jgi:transposase
MLRMYIRSVTRKNKKTGEVYTTYRLAESYRNAQGKVRQQALLNLKSDFAVPKENWALLANRVEDICKGQQSFFDLENSLEKEAHRIAKLIIQKLSVTTSTPQVDPTFKSNTDFQTVDVNTLQHQHVRKIGAEYVGYHAAQQLELEPILKELGFNQKQIYLALGTIIGRLVHPASELNTHRYLSEHSALDELLGADFSDLSLKNFYKIADQLLKHKLVLEQKLYQRETDLFQLENIITLFDITNTYFEGKCLINTKAQYGRSKEKRSDRPLVALGMVLDASGFPKKSEIFPGNISEPKTLEQMLSTLGNDKKKVTVVMDAGIATQDNIDWLQSTGYRYIVVSRKRNLVMPTTEESILVKEEKGNEVEAVLIKNEDTAELELYCHSQAKEAKAKHMVSKVAHRYEAELQKLVEGLHKKRGTKKYNKVLEKLGRLKEKYKKVAYLYDLSVTTDEQEQDVIKIVWKRNDNAMTRKEKGIYCLRTNRTDLDASTFWDIYTMLTELESAFRSLKSELGMRPVYHQKENRVDAHLFISILAYHLLHTIRYQLKTQGIKYSWETLRELLDTQCRITSTLKLKNGKTVQIRKTSSPDPNQLNIYKALRIGSHPGKTEKIYC